ncbi:MAG: hypothetical protein HZA95_02375 [Candidatus Vogelbacteria bacterium]|nr:hypothetical protein [Candidatus Vogelbacteria bacterium]
MSNELNEGRLTKAEEILNNPQSGTLERRRSGVIENPPEIEHAWNLKKNDMGTRKKIKGAKFVFMIAALFFLVAIGIAAFMYSGGGNVVSGNNIDIALGGPLSVKGGEEVTFNLSIVNNNSIGLELADITMTFPEGTRTADSKSLTYYRKSIGTIGSNQSTNETIKAVFYGKENTDKVVAASLEYRIAGSNAIFAKEKKFYFKMESSPLTITLDAPADANSGQEIILNLRAVSNSKTPIKGLIMQLRYPPGFIFKSSVPNPISGYTDTWNIGDMQAEGQRAVVVKGIVNGQDDEVKSFNVTVGTVAESDSSKIGTAYNQASQTIMIKRPFVGLHIGIDGADVSGDTFTAESSTVLRNSITWSNDMPSRIMDGELVAKLSGLVLDQSSVNVDDGFYRSGDNTIIWDKSTLPSMAEIASGAKNKLDFTFQTLPLITSGNSIYPNPEIDIDFVFTGTRVADSSGNAGRVETKVSKKIKFSTVAQLVSRSVHYVGPIPNRGQLPPKVGAETTYTVIWSLVNSSNNLSGAVVKASLPSYVKYTGQFLPSYEKVAYDGRTGLVTWDVGNLKGGTGLTLPAREIAFQIALTPSISQSGLVVPLTGDSTLTGKDDFTAVQRTNSKRGLTTELTTDERSRDGEYRVVQ